MLQTIESELFLPQKYDQLSVGVSGGVCTSGVRAPLRMIMVHDRLAEKGCGWILMWNDLHGGMELLNR